MKAPLLILLALPLVGQSLPSPEAGRPYCVQGRYVVTDGDIIAGTVDQLSRDGSSLKDGGRAAISTGSAFWPRNGSVVQIPYVNQSTDANVANAIAAVNRQLAGVLQLVARTNEADYAVFTNDRGLCNSWVGRRGGAQDINATGCGTTGAIHEIGHAIGLQHMASHPDRASFLQVFPDEITRLEPIAVTPPHRIITPFSYRAMVDNQVGTTRRGRLHYETIPAGIPLEPMSDQFSENEVDAIRRLCGMAPAQVTISSHPAGLRILVDGTAITAPRAFDWALNSTHTIEVPDEPQALGNQVHVFGNWSNLGQRRQTITVTPGAGRHTDPSSSPAVTLYTANFIRYSPINVDAAPGSATLSPGPVTFPQGAFYRERQVTRVTAVPPAGQSVYGWSGSGSFYLPPPQAGNPVEISPRGATELYPAYTNRPVTTITSNPPFLRVLVNGSSRRTPVSYADSQDSGWTPGSTQQVGVAAEPQEVSAGESRYVFDNWSDGGGANHPINANDTPGTTKVVTANFRAEFRVSASLAITPASCGGSINLSPNTADGYYREGTQLQLTATPPEGFVFTGWSGWPELGNTATATAAVTRERFPVAMFNITGTPLRMESVSPAILPLGAEVTVTLTGSGFSGSNLFVGYQTDVDSGSKRAVIVSPTQVQITLSAAELQGSSRISFRALNYSGNCAAQSEPITVTVGAAAVPPTTPTAPASTTTFVAFRGWQGGFVTVMPNGSVIAPPAAEGGTPNGSQVFVMKDLNGGTLADGDLVCLQVPNGNFLTAAVAAPGRISVGPATDGTHERFVVRLQGGSISLRASNGQWIAAEGNGDLNANRGGVGLWEMFGLVTLTTPPPAVRVSRVSLRNWQGGLITVGNGNALVGGPGTPGNAQQVFTLTDLNGGELATGDVITLQAQNGNYVTFSTPTPNALSVGPSTPGTNEQFSVQMQGGSISLRAANGLWVTMEGSGEVRANRAAAQGWEMFGLETVP